MDVDCVKECRRPEGSWESRAVEEGPDLDGEFIVHYLGCAVLRWTVGAGGFDYVVELLHEVEEVCTSGQFAALIGAN